MLAGDLGFFFLFKADMSLQCTFHKERFSGGLSFFSHHSNIPKDTTDSGIERGHHNMLL